MAAVAEIRVPPYEGEDVLQCQEALFEWAESFDTKNWARLAKCIAPTLYLDYRDVMGQLWDALPASDFVQLASNPSFLGNARIKTQHFIGTSKWVCVGDGEITGFHQMRVAHQRYREEEAKQVLRQGHAHGQATIRYRRVAGVWKLAGLTPDIRWTEHEYDKIFEQGDEEKKEY